MNLRAGPRWLLILLAPPFAAGCHVMAGDSITRLARDHTYQAANNSSFYIDAEAARGPNNVGVDNNRTTNEVIDLLTPYIDVGEWLIVQEDGGNETTETYRAFVDRTVAALPDDRCLAWMTPYNTAYVERDAAFTAEIRAGIQAQPCYAIIEWAEVVSVNPTAYLADGLHPNPAGAVLFASLVALVVPQE